MTCSCPVSVRATLKRGDMVKVEVYGGDLVWRRVWDVNDVVVDITTEARYWEALAADEEPPYVGFRWEYVKEMRDGRRR